MSKTEIITPDGTMDTTLEMLANRGIRLGPIERDILRSNLNANAADLAALRAGNAKLREALKDIANVTGNLTWFTEKAQLEYAIKTARAALA